MFRLMSYALVLLIVATWVLPGPAAAQTPSASAPVTTTAIVAKWPARILFVGDHLSYTLGPRFRRLAASGDPSLQLRAVEWTKGGTTLRVFWETGQDSQVADIRAGQWDVVVLEEYPEMGTPAEEFLEYTRKFDEAIKQGGARTVLFMPWANKDGYPISIEGIAALYGQMAAAIDAPVAPVGLAFQRAMRERPGVELYNADEDNDNALGLYLKMCVLYATLLGNSPVGLPYRLEPNDGNFMSMGAGWTLSDADAAFLQQVAWDTVVEYQARK